MSNTDKKFIEPWIETGAWDKVDFTKIPNVSYVVSLAKLEENFKILHDIEVRTGAKILMALKSFSMFSTFPLARKYLSGSEASSINEARLGYEEFKKENHVFSPSYTKENIKEYIKYSDHLVFNSFSNFESVKDLIKKSNLSKIGRAKKVSCGIRVNPEHCETETAMYDPCAPCSHFGVTSKNFVGQNLDGIEGLHFHTLCELNSDALERTLAVFEEKFGKYLTNMKWVNFGGGHHITRADYDRELLVKIILGFKQRYPQVQVYLEPGEANGLNAGVLVGTVLDVFNNDVNIAVLDVSATTHMPDVLEMPYAPTILGVKHASYVEATIAKKDTKNIYKLVGPSCLTGDVIGEYEFEKPLQIGQKVVFMNMAIYTMVKNNTFNGIDLPSIYTIDKKNKFKLIKKFNYKDFKNRLS